VPWLAHPRAEDQEVRQVLQQLPSINRDALCGEHEGRGDGKVDTPERKGSSGGLKDVK
jgi:hypothetical protein